MSRMEWDWANAIMLLSPVVLLWGWIHYFKLPSRAGWRSHASLVGLSAPLLSVAAWGLAAVVVSINGSSTASSAVDRFIAVGEWIPLIGIVVGLAGRPRLILAIVPACIGALFFWVGTTMP